MTIGNTREIGTQRSIRLMNLIRIIRKGKTTSMKSAMLEAGYSESYSNTPGFIRNTPEYKRIMSTVVEQLEKERERIIQAMSVKDLGDEKYRDLAEVFDKMNKNIQLLSGKPTGINKLDLTDLSDDELTKLATESGEPTDEPTEPSSGGISEERISEETSS